MFPSLKCRKATGVKRKRTYIELQEWNVALSWEVFLVSDEGNRTQQSRYTGRRSLTQSLFVLPITFKLARFDILTAVLTKFQVFTHMTPRGLANSYRHARLLGTLDSSDGGKILLRNFDKSLPVYSAWYPRITESSIFNTTGKLSETCYERDAKKFLSSFVKLI